MDIFRRIFFAAVLAGAVAGLAYAAIQQWRVVPLILEAELYEDAGHSHAEDAAAHSHDRTTEAEAWAPADGFERTAYTVLATVLAGAGFTLIIAAVAVISGLPLTPANGVLWGLGGFLAFNLAPAFGLPPELPGMAAADLPTRQVWWWGTVLATGAGILAIARFRTPTAIAGAAALILVPHLIGAPAAPETHSALPAHLATAYAAAALGAAMAFWMIAGSLLGWANQRFGGASA